MRARFSSSKTALWDLFQRHFKNVRLGFSEFSELSFVDRKLALGHSRKPPGTSATSFWFWCWQEASGENPGSFLQRNGKTWQPVVRSHRDGAWLVPRVRWGGGEKPLKAKSLTSWPFQKSVVLFNLFLIGIPCRGFPFRKGKICPFNYFLSKDLS